MTTKTEHMIVDAAGFLKNVKLQDLADNIYTIQEVVNEIRDSATRQRLAVLPYELKFKSPSTESITHVSDFAKKTGDWGSLSATDIKVMALTYQLTKEKVGSEHLKKVPEKKMTITCSKKPLQKATDIEGFYYPDKTNSEKEIISSNVEESADEVKNNQETETKLNETKMEEGDNVEKAEQLENKDDLSKDNLIDEDPVNDVDMDGEEDEEIGWITPSNISQVKQYNESEQIPASGVGVGCLTTDFAMQNVLIQIGLSVVSVDGMLIKRAKSYALRCYSCFKITSNTQKVFCPKCGNKTMTKVTVTVDEDGTQRYHLSSRRAINTRGLKYPLPLPKGGKHAMNPVLCEDQPAPQNKPAKKTLAKINAFDPDFVARGSPFAVNDVTSRAAQIGMSGASSNSRRRNPNEVRRKKGRKK
ncbi:RNA-binding protein NOB1-like [Antedon mediterranea]|uniref:RNA-binding protein NOB1-like n=1 Tax=Antedon mediterranea TaxID=105859 RepID=UPI003AF4F00F